MTQALQKSLYSIAAGFKFDRDEDWVTYLSPEEAKYMRDERAWFLASLEELDEFKQARRETSSPSEKKDLDKKIAETTAAIDEIIRELLSKIPKLKQKALKAQDDAIAADLSSSNQPSVKRQRVDEDLFEVNTDLDYIDKDAEYVPDDLLPTYYVPIPPAPSTSRSRPTISRPPSSVAKVTTQSARPSAPARDTFLDNVDPRDIPILLPLKSLIKVYDCKDRVLDAIERIRKRDNCFAALDSLNEYFKTQHKSKSN